MPHDDAERRRKAFRSAAVAFSPGFLVIGDFVMVSAWELPVQERLAELARPAGRDVLEIGYGLGMCARRIQTLIPRSHTIVEAHPVVAHRARLDVKPATVLAAFSEELEAVLPRRPFGSIVFDAYPLSQSHFDGSDSASLAYAVGALPLIAAYLADDGQATIIDFSRAICHHDQLLKRAALFGLAVTSESVEVAIPSDCAYASGTAADILILTRP